MTIWRLLFEIEARTGRKIQLCGNGFKVRRASSLTPELRQAIRDRAEEIFEALRPEPAR